MGADHQGRGKEVENGKSNESIESKKETSSYNIIFIQSNNFVSVNIAASHNYTTKSNLIWNQFNAMFLKRIVSVKRSWYLFLIQVVIPSVFVIMAVTSASPATEAHLPALDLSLSKYTDPITLIEPSSSNTIVDPYKEQYVKLVNSKTTDNMTDTMLTLVSHLVHYYETNLIVKLHF